MFVFCLGMDIFVGIIGWLLIRVNKVFGFLLYFL